MKKQIILSVITILMYGIIGQTHAQTPDGSVEYIYQIPSYQVKDTILPWDYGISQTFSFIEINDNKHDETDSIGFPLLPQFLLNMNVPKNSYNYVISLTIRQVDTFHVSKQLLPAQEDMLENDTIAYFSMNNSFYLSSDTFLNFNPVLLEEYITFGEKGILLAMNPFRYIPSEGLVKVLTNAVITVTYMLEEEESGNNQRVTPSTEQYFSQLFANYRAKRGSGNQVMENYLIITAPEFENIISDFVQYKSNIGYNVTVVNTNTTGISSSSIKTYIQNQYNNTSTRPEYVLLVGDIDKIPASAGVEKSRENPITDLEYVLLEGNDERADVYIGRFSVQNDTQLMNVISKTIFMEKNMQLLSKQVTLVSGHAAKLEGQRRFKKVQEIIRPYLESAGYTCNKIYAQDGDTYSDAVNALSDNNIYYIYRGHGYEDELLICRTRYSNICGPNCSDISSSNAYTYPIFLSVACLSGDYAKPNCFGEHCLRNPHGAAAFWGATEETNRGKNNKMQKSIFSHFSENLTLSSWLQLGINDYYKPKRKSHIRAYNLLGDPSFRLGGIDCFYNYIFTQNVSVPSGGNLNIQADHLIRNDNTLTVSSGANVYLQAGDEIILSEGFHAATGSDFEAVIAPCSGRNVPQSMAAGNSLLPIGYADLPSQRESSETGITEPNVKQSLKLWPNPVSGMLHIQLPDAEKGIARITVCDLLGRVVLQKENLPKPEMEVSSLTNGMYLLQLRLSDGTNLTAKFVKD